MGIIYNSTHDPAPPPNVGILSPHKHLMPVSSPLLRQTSQAAAARLFAFQEWKIVLKNCSMLFTKDKEEGQKDPRQGIEN